MNRQSVTTKLVLKPHKFGGQFSHLVKSTNRFVIAGYASYNIVDSQNDLVNLKALGTAFTRMMAVPERRNLIYHHSNVQIGKILLNYMDPEGNMWESGVDDYGLFIIAEIFNDVVKAQEVMKDMMQGKYLAFSIGGQALERVENCDGDKCWSEIVNMDLHEITSCERGANISARGVIFEKSADSFMDIAKMSVNNDTFINNNVNNSSEGIFVPKDIVEKTDLQLVLDAVSELKTFVESIKPAEAELVEVGEIVEKEDTITLNAIATILDERFAAFREAMTPVVVEKEEIKEIIEEVADIVEIVEIEAVTVEKLVYVYDEPLEEAFEKKEDFEDALVKYQALVEKIKDEMGEPITKSTGIVEDLIEESVRGIVKIDFKKLYSDAFNARSPNDLLEKIGEI